MDYLVAVILGLVQGLTEFLPVSSSGYLAIVNLIFGTDLGGGISYAVWLHVATLVAAFIYFRRDIAGLLVCWLPRSREMKRERRLFLMLVAASFVTGPIGLLIEPRLEFMSESLLWLACGFFATTLVLSFAEWATRTKQHGRLKDMKWPQAALVGLAQGIAVIPGLSRSGATIAGGMLGGLQKKEATRFAFLVGLPIILMGALKDAIPLAKGEVELLPLPVALVGFVVAGISGYAAISWMIASLNKVKLYWFGVYTALLGVVLLTLWIMGG